MNRYRIDRNPHSNSWVISDPSARLRWRGPHSWCDMKKEISGLTVEVRWYGRNTMALCWHKDWVDHWLVAWLLCPLRNDPVSVMIPRKTNILGILNPAIRQPRKSCSPDGRVTNQSPAGGSTNSTEALVDEPPIMTWGAEQHNTHLWEWNVSLSYIAAKRHCMHERNAAVCQTQLPSRSHAKWSRPTLTPERGLYSLIRTWIK